VPGGTVLYEVKNRLSVLIEHRPACTGNARLKGGSRFPLYLYPDWWICTNHFAVVPSTMHQPVAHTSRSTIRRIGRLPAPSMRVISSSFPGLPPQLSYGAFDICRPDSLGRSFR